jgi:hypothetical protein
MVWAVVPMPDFLQIILVEILMMMFLVLIGGFFSLGITMYRYLFSSTNNGKEENNSKTEIDEIFENQATFELFYEYSKKEFSIENVLYKVDSNQYKKLKNEKKRLKHAQLMEIKYLSGQSSPLEINVDQATLAPVLESLHRNQAPIDLLKNLDSSVMKNLSDTHGRFKFSRLFKDFKRKSFNTQNAVGDRRDSGVTI